MAQPTYGDTAWWSPLAPVLAAAPPPIAAAALVPEALCAGIGKAPAPVLTALTAGAAGGRGGRPSRSALASSRPDAELSRSLSPSLLWLPADTMRLRGGEQWGQGSGQTSCDEGT